MGQINPISVRLNVNRQQNSLWFSKNNYTKNLHKQLLLKTYISQVFQVSNLLLGPCYIQMLPKKLKIYPFFNNSTKSTFQIRNLTCLNVMFNLNIRSIAQLFLINVYLDHKKLNTHHQ